MNILEIPLIARIRRNHALEHATIHVLTEHNPRRHLMGRATARGFYLFGEAAAEEVAAAASEALSRLQRGEHSLAVHPRCGTNLATAGVLAGLSSFLVMSGRSKASPSSVEPSRLAKLPQIILAATISVMAAQPLGLALQKHVTTLPEVEGVTIETITRQRSGQVVVHHVYLGQRSTG
ncbi:MAG: hypothetical protein H8E47_11620 [Anaerolineales bacterium]|nr:hypothetical protein [Anaerolineales bacterium]